MFIWWVGDAEEPATPHDEQAPSLLVPDDTTRRSDGFAKALRTVIPESNLVAVQFNAKRSIVVTVDEATW
jgi:hypothetical protein